jgi:2'-hydroxyisoflavone reductase
MRILILGGTAFLSAATARQALQLGHQVTCLARGQGSRPPEGAEWVRADRDDGQEAYEQVADTDWDAVIDVARQPGHVRSALSALADRTRHWTFVSSCSVYSDDATAGQDESGPVHEPFEDDHYTDEADYGPAKVGCENACLAAVGDRLHISRAGLIGGPGDESDRFGWWPARFARHDDDDVLVPNALEMPMQVIDVDDLAQWLVLAAEQQVAGIFNAVGDSAPLGDFVDTARQVAGHRGRQVVVDTDFLLGQQVGYWMGPESLGLWLPPDHTGFGARSHRAATAAGLRLRTVVEATERALAYERELGLERDRRTGLTPAKEAELLRLWAATA